MRKLPVVVVIITVCLLASCAGLPGAAQVLPHSEVFRDELTRGCTNFFAALDDAVTDSGANDGQAARIVGFPYLRADRLLSSFREEVQEGARFDAWVDRLQALDQQARAAEVANLPEMLRQSLIKQMPQARTLAANIETCGSRLRKTDLGEPEIRQELKERARVSDEYRNLYRVLGLYPLTSQFVALGIAQGQDETRRRFSTPLESIPTQGQWLRYVSPSTDRLLNTNQVAAILHRSAHNPLGIPEPEGTDLQDVYATFAPVFEVAVSGDFDRIGSPHWGAENYPLVDTKHPTVYTRVSHARYAGQVLLQLNYIIWFSERPRSGLGDILGGHLDGINWRITLAQDGRPLLYDSMHNCGCYHLLFPSPQLSVKESLMQVNEPPLIPQQAPLFTQGERLVLRVAPVTHYLERLLATGNVGQGTVYQLENYNELRSLPTANGDARRSLFQPDGIVAGTQRRERFILWPMGIPAPGAMRQWGHHAIAFAGRRHFDDADLIEQLFTTVN